MVSTTINHKKVAESLNEGIHAKLDFDFACERGHVFCEAYLYGVVMEILGSRLDPQRHIIKSGDAVSALQKKRKDARGRRSEVDFAIYSKKANVLEAAIEIKWAKSTYATRANIIKDLTRLALISEMTGLRNNLFILAGPATEVESLFNGEYFSPEFAGCGFDGPALGCGAALSRLPRGREVKTVTDARFYYEGKSKNITRILNRARIEELKEDLPALPRRVITSLYGSITRESQNWKVLVWRVHA